MATIPIKTSSDGSADSTGASVAAPHLSERDSDAASAVESALSDLGADRSALEGPAATVVIPDADDGEKSKPSASTKTAPGKAATQARGEDGKFTADDKGGAKTAATNNAKESKPTDAKPATDSPDIDLDLSLTAEELAEIDKNPLTKKMYKTVVRGANKKAQELAEQIKGNQGDLDIMKTVRENPVAALQALAAMTGVPISIGDGKTAATTTTDQTSSAQASSATPKLPLTVAEEALSKVFNPDGAKLLAPALVQIAKAVATEELTPIRMTLDESRQQLASAAQAQARARIATELSNYGRSVESRGDDWNEDIQNGMAELVGKVLPGQGTTLPEFLDTLYYRYTGARAQASVRQKQLQRLRAAVASTEPTHTTRSAPNLASDRRITADMSDAEASALAVAQALEELRGA